MAFEDVLHYFPGIPAATGGTSFTGTATTGMVSGSAIEPAFHIHTGVVVPSGQIAPVWSAPTPPLPIDEFAALIIVLLTLMAWRKLRTVAAISS